MRARGASVACCGFRRQTAQQVQSGRADGPRSHLPAVPVRTVAAHAVHSASAHSSENRPVVVRLRPPTALPVARLDTAYGCERWVLEAAQAVALVTLRAYCHSLHTCIGWLGSLARRLRTRYDLSEHSFKRIASWTTADEDICSCAQTLPRLVGWSTLKREDLFVNSSRRGLSRISYLSSTTHTCPGIKRTG